MLYNIVILFLLFFCFPIPGAVNSIWIAAAVALGRIVVKGRLSFFYHNLCSKYVVGILVATGLLILYSFLVTIFTEAYDFSRTMALLSLFIGLLLVIVVYSSLSFDHVKDRDLERSIIVVFVIQSMISVLAFVSPSFREIVSLFQFQDDAELASLSYAGFRGLAISGRLYFEFAATCGLATIIQMRRILEQQHLSYYLIVEFLLLIVCGFFAGRTALVGLAFAFLLLIVYRRHAGYKMAFIRKLLLSLFFVGFLGFVLLPGEILALITEHLLPWVFDLFIKVYETGSTESSASFNNLNEMYETIHISLQEWIVGSGQYSNADGSYYKHVDAGYLRQLLYWGLVGSFINLIYSIRFFVQPWRVHKGERNETYFLSTLFVYTLVVHYKGDLMGISRFYYVILFMYLLHIYFSANREALQGRPTALVDFALKK